MTTSHETIILDLSKASIAELDRIIARCDAAIPVLNAETLLGNKPLVVAPYEGGPDGPIREPGDDAASWDDVYTADELVVALSYQATRQARSGATHIAEELNCASDAIADMAAKLEVSRDTTARLVQKITELRKQLRDESERCSEHRDCLAGAGHAGECDIDHEARS